MSETPALPPGLLVAFYGDDFTGSSAVMEVLTFAGVPTLLLLEPPSESDLARYSAYRAIGIAGIARAQSPEWMDVALPPVFRTLEGLGAPVTHYKTCSTFDSSVAVGSIGRAIDLAVPIFGQRRDGAEWVPLVVGAPPIGRYQAFGNLFAAYGGRNYRLDRHPVMRRHPVTPMAESDLAIHLGAQTSRAVGLVDVAAIKSGAGGAQLRRELDSGRSVVSIDVLDEETLSWAGEEIWDGRRGGIFAVGSQGVEYALTAYWRQSGMLPDSGEPAAPEPVGQIIVASGSVSPVTADQIAWAARNGFAIVAIDAAKAVDANAWRAEIAAAGEAGKALLSDGKSVLMATAEGPDDARVGRLNQAIKAAGADRGAVNAAIGKGLGEAVCGLVAATGIRRVALAGGDTSGFAAGAMGIKALTALAPLAPGSPLCRAVADEPDVDGLEICLKGGQMGGADFFGRVRDGRASGAAEN